jgi:hypothetical protein
MSDKPRVSPAGKGDKDRSTFSPKYKENFDQIKKRKLSDEFWDVSEPGFKRKIYK